MSFLSQISKISREAWATARPNAWLQNFYSAAPSSEPVFVLSFDIDLERDIKNIPCLVEELNKRNLKACFAVIGQWVEKFPEEHRLLAQAGHEIINHTWSHPNNPELSPRLFFDRMSKDEKGEEIRKGHEIIFEKLEYKSQGFRVPHFGNLFTEDIYPVLQNLNYKFSSSTLSVNTPKAGQPFLANNNIMEFPVATCPQHPFSSFDSWHSIKRPSSFPKPGALHKRDGEFRHLFNTLLKWIKENKIYMSLYFDPADFVPNNDTFGILDDLKNSRDEIKYCFYGDLLPA